MSYARMLLLPHMLLASFVRCAACLCHALHACADALPARAYCPLLCASNAALHQTSLAVTWL
eukprot:1159507-Pelagomonas_calceolata.AAC.3